MKLNKLLAATTTALTTLLVFPSYALAYDPVNINLNITNSQWNGLTNLTAGGVVAGLIRLVLVIAAILFFFMLVIGGIQWIISGGDKAGSENARKRITSALVGLAIVFSAWAIVTLVNTLFGVNIMNLTIPNLLNP